MTDMARLRALAMSATAGPWRASIGRFGVGALSAERKSLLLAEVRTDGHRPGHRDSLYAERNEDAAYIAAASPSTVLTLLDRLDALEKALRLIHEWHGPIEPFGIDESPVCICGIALLRANGAPISQSPTHLEDVK